MGQISAPVRVAALAGLLAAAAMGVWLLTAGRGTGTTSSVSEPSAVRAPVAKTQPVATPVRNAQPKAKPAVTENGTSLSIASLLRTHKVVVVLLYDPQAPVDGYSFAEAQLGAKQSKAAFVPVNVLDQHQAAPFTEAYGVLQDPTVLFFARPGKLVQKLTGFADHESVGQAAVNAALGVGGRKP